MVEVKSLVRECILRLKPYVPGKPIEELRREMGIEDVDIIKLASNENSFGPSPAAITALGKALSDVYLYPEGSCPELRTKLAQKFNVTEDSVIVTNGADALIKLLAETFLNAGDEVVIPDPSFVEYEFAGTLMDAHCVKVPLTGDFRVDLSGMLKSIGPKTKLVFICNPNNPTGTIVTRSELERFMSSVPDNVIVVFDEAYGEFATDPEYISGLEFLKAGREVLIMKTFSKVYGLAGLRVGYGISTPEIIGYISRTREPFHVNRLGEVAALAALADEEHVKRCVAAVDEERKFLYDGLKQLGLSYVESQANFVLIKLPMPGMEVFQQLLPMGVIVRPGEPIGVPNSIRLTVGTHEQNQRVLSALKQVLKQCGKN